MRKRIKYPNYRFPLGCCIKGRLETRPLLGFQLVSNFYNRVYFGIGVEVSILERRAIYRRYKETTGLTLRAEVIARKHAIVDCSHLRIKEH